MVTNTTPTVLITGASRGLGAALARALARLGWTLILDARGADALEALRLELSAQTRVIAIPGDITDPAHRADLLAAAQACGGLSALVNNASTLGSTPRPLLLDYPLESLAQVYQTNVFAPLALIQTLRHTFRPEPRIVNITSDAGVEPYEGWGGYGSSKAALEHLSAVLANEVPDWRVYWVDPGDMNTTMHQDAFPGEDISDRPPPEESVPGFITLLTGNLPGGRYQSRDLTAVIAESRNTAHAMVKGMRVVLTVTDFVKARALYEEGLGLPVIDQWLAPDSNGILFDAGQATLEIFDAGQAAEVDQIELGAPSENQVRLAFVVDAVDSAAASVSQFHAIKISDPVLTPWNHLNQRFRAAKGIHEKIDLTLSQVVESNPQVVS
jgi:NAD(P)-dependent dehydrogenase (short-subunit alcohol dehydrogenase family)/catechol 2,3-dioxygenase-like lactoylglutathione lyase family enzyme